MTPEAQEILGLYFPVLDHGFVALLDVMGDDLEIERAARISYGAGTRRSTETRGLIRYLLRHRHTTPFEMVELKFHMALPIFVARQLIRHRTASVNEYSARYSIVPELYYMPSQFELQSQTNRQGRSENVLQSPDSHLNAMRKVALRAQLTDHYRWQLGKDVARELARIDLPLSTYTQWYWKIDLHNLFHFLGLRSDSHAQKEIRAYSDVMAAMASRVAPVAFDAWYDYEFYGERFSRQEMEFLRSLIRRSGANLYTGVQPGEGATTVVTEGGCLAAGMSKRETDEFFEKFDLLVQQPRHFELDLANARSADYFAGLWSHNERL